jgi:Sulfate permease family
MSVITRLAPPSLWGYQRSWLPRDIVAGVTLAAVAIPETMGYTSIAQTPVATGLYTVIFPALAFALLGSSRLLVVGADSATAAILAAGLAGLGILPDNTSPSRQVLIEFGLTGTTGCPASSSRSTSRPSGSPFILFLQDYWPKKKMLSLDYAVPPVTKAVAPVTAPDGGPARCRR